MKLHPKVQALRNSVGASPIKKFYPTVAIDSTRAATVDESSRRVKMYFAIFGVPDDYGTVPVKGCFTKSLQERGPGSASNYKIVVLWQHDQKDPLCLPVILQEDEHGLYGEFEPDDVPSGNRCITQIRSGTINQGSYGFNYVWDKIEYDDKTGLLFMKEVDLYEVSPVTIGSQKETHAVRSADGTLIDEFLEEETSDLMKLIPRKHHLEFRSIIDRHISLAKAAALDTRKALQEPKPKKVGLDMDYLINKLKKD
jgi:HK97 family phage prohead protease